MRRALVVVVLLLAGCNAAPPAPPRVEHHAFEGVASATFDAPQIANHTVAVPDGAAGLNGTLLWNDTTAIIFVQIVAPNGTIMATGRQEAPGRSFAATADEVAGGTWTYRVTATNARNASYRLLAAVEIDPPRDNVFAEQRTLRPRGAVEVNMQMEEGAEIHVRLATEGGMTDWDLHSHEPGQSAARVHAFGRTTADEEFRATKRGVYSFYVHNMASNNVEIDYRVEGAFRVVSVVR